MEDSNDGGARPSMDPQETIHMLAKPDHKLAAIAPENVLTIKDDDDDNEPRRLLFEKEEIRSL